MEQHSETQPGQDGHTPGDRDSDFPAVEYAGFWIRFLASVLDSILVMMVIVPLLLTIYGPGVLFSMSDEPPGLAYILIVRVLPIIAVIIFWQYRAATPGKIMMDIYIVDADTLRQPTFGRLLLRYIGYYLSLLPFFLGFFWIGWDKRKQGFHDKIANTVVIKKTGAVVSSADYIRKQLGEDTKAEAPARPPAGTDPWRE